MVFVQWLCDVPRWVDDDDDDVVVSFSLTVAMKCQICNYHQFLLLLLVESITMLMEDKSSDDYSCWKLVVVLGDSNR